MTLPEPLTALLKGRRETLLGSLLTAGERAIGRDVAPIWCLVTDRRAWLAASGPDGAVWAVAVGERAAFEVDRGWARDAIRVGGHTAPLRTGTRRAALALVDRFVGGGEPIAIGAPVDAHEALRERAPAARGAVVPAGWVEQVPASSSERWLAVAATATRWPVNADGTVRWTWLHLGVTDARAIVAAPGFVAPLEAVRFAAPRSRAGFDAALAVARAAPGAARWAEAARQAVDQAPARAIALVAEARERHQHDRCWPIVARLLAALGQTERAVAAGARALEITPDLDVGALVEAPSLDRALKRDGIDRATLVVRWSDLLSELDSPRPLDGLPWPPSSAHEVAAAALALHGRWEDAERRIVGDDLRAEQARGAIRAAAGRESAADRWRRAAWEAETGGDPAPFWDQALALDPEGALAGRVPLPLARQQALARHAAAVGARAAAAAAWQRVTALAPADEAARDEAARLLSALGRPDEAHRVWAERLRALDDGVIPSPAVPRWRVTWELARLAPERGVAHLLDGLTIDFLHPEAWALALDCPGVELGALRGWWQHVHRLLAGEGVPEGAPLPPATRLDADRLDALHPGGVGWFERARTSIRPAELPSRAALTRGLGRLDASEHPEAVRLLRAACDALGLAPPDAWLFRGEGAWGASAWSTDPPVLLVGARHLREGERHLDERALTFLLGVELAHLRAGHPILAFETDLVGTSRSAYAAFGRYAGTAETVVDLVTLVPGVDQLAKLQTVVQLSRRVFAARSAMEKAGTVAGPVLGWLGLGGDDQPGSIGRERLVGAAMQFRVHADRAALLLGGDLRAAVDAILRSSSRSVHLAHRVRAEGLAAVLADPERGPAADETVRITSLVAFAATLGGDVRAEAQPEGSPPEAPS